MVCDLSTPPSGPPQLHQENGGSFSKDEMGCGVSKKTMVVPVEETDPDRASDSEPSDDQIHESQEDVPKPTKAQAMAFEVPVNEESIIRKHPPRRLQRLEDQQAILSHELLDEKQEEAKQRRFQILTQRVRSAKRSSKRFLDNDISSQNDFQIETMKNENSTLEL